MFCTGCGRQIDENTKFCPFCGRKVEAQVNRDIPQAGAAPAYSDVPAGGSGRPVKAKKKVIFCVAAALVVIAAVAVIVVGVKLLAGNRTEDDRTDESSGRVRKQADAGDNGNERDDIEDDEAGDSGKDTGSEANGEGKSDSDSGEADEEMILEALTAYQEYMDDLEDVSGLKGIILAYLDQDNVPELILIGAYEAAGQMIVTYHDGELTENYISRLGGLRYVEKQNFYHNSNGHMGFYFDEFYMLADGEQTVIASGEWGDKYDEKGNIIWNEDGDYPEQEYSWDGVSCSEEQYYKAMNDFVKAEAGDVEFTYVDPYGGDIYLNVLEAYNGLNIKKYSACWPQIVDFDLKGGVLTFSSDSGERYGWGGGEMGFSISYPVAADCIWENRSVGMGEAYQPQVGDTDYIGDTSYEEIKEWIDAERTWYDEAVATYGSDEVWLESPVNVVVVVEEGVVVRVYTVIS